MAEGHWDKAREAFTAAAAIDNTSAIPWLELARGFNRDGNSEGEEEALFYRIKSVRGDMTAIFAMAECKRRRHDRRAAVSFYQLALSTAALLGNASPKLANILNRAREYVAESTQYYEDYLIEKIHSAGVDTAHVPPRVGTALRLLTGEEELYPQQPNAFYFPGLAQRAWWESAEFEWAHEIEAQSDIIRSELLALTASTDSPYEPYVTASANRPPPNNPLLDKPDWGAIWIWKDGSVQKEMHNACPATLAALEKSPQPIIADVAPIALFSRLKPGTHIMAHCGLLNTRLICHLPLIVPEGCSIRVGSETRQWNEGKLLIFDDSIEHEAQNRGQSDRTVLLFEIWRPDITDEEREILTRIFAAVGMFKED